MSGTGTSRTRKRILDAAAARLLEHGPHGLVLEAVAADAAVSKGGLLYHYPSKDALIDGLITRMLDDFDAFQEGLVAADSERAGRWSRAYLAATVTDDGQPADNSAQLMAGILAAIDNDPARLSVIRDRFSGWHARIGADGIDPVRATLVRLAADGLWLMSLLGLPGIDPSVQVGVLRELRRMTQKDSEATPR